MRLSTIFTLSLLASACSTEVGSDPSLEGAIPFHPQRPATSDVVSVQPYSGSNADVLDAQKNLRTGLDLHAKVIYRTCTPNGGVCHNNKEYPDLHTPANFLAAIDAPCNVQPGTFESVYDRCERPGDRFSLGERGQREVGYLVYVPGENQNTDTPDANTPGLHVYLADPLTSKDDEFGAGARFIRSFVDDRGAVGELTFATFSTRWRLLDGGKHVFGRVREDQVTEVQELLTVGIIQGDQNRNGIFGARQSEPVRLLRPGKPEESYLIGRLRGVMLGGTVPGSRMPLANQPLSVSEMLALFCFVEGLGKVSGAPNLDSMIDYAGCTYSADPQNLNLLGSGVTWARRVKNILEFNCGGCHSGKDPQAGLDLKDGMVYARLLQPSQQKTDLALIKPGAPLESYLWLKLTGAPGIIGSRMPFNPLTGQGKLSDAELNDIKSWIMAGAVEDQ